MIRWLIYEGLFLGSLFPSLAHVSMPAPHCPDYYGFAVEFDARRHGASGCVLAQDGFGYWGIFRGSTPILGLSFPISVNKGHWGFAGGAWTLERALGMWAP